MTNYNCCRRWPTQIPLSQFRLLVVLLTFVYFYTQTNATAAAVVVAIAAVSTTRLHCSRVEHFTRFVPMGSTVQFSFLFDYDIAHCLAVRCTVTFHYIFVLLCSSFRCCCCLFVLLCASILMQLYEYSSCDVAIYRC